MTTPDLICAWCHPPDLADAGHGEVIMCGRHQKRYDQLTARLTLTSVPVHPADRDSLMEGITGGTPEPPADPLAELNEAVGWLNDMETAYRDRLLALAKAGGTPEAICTVAIDDRIRRFPRIPGQVPSWGATAVDFGRAAVEALRVTGHLPPEDGQRATVEELGASLARAHTDFNAAAEKLEQVTRERDGYRELNAVLAQGVREPRADGRPERRRVAGFLVRHWVPVGAVVALAVVVAVVMLAGG